MLVRLVLSVVAVLVLLPPAQANDLMRLYQQAQGADQTLAAARHARDAAVEARPQALAGILPQLSGSGALTRQKTDYLGTTSTFLRAGTSAYATNKSWSVALDDTLFSIAAFRKLGQADVSVAAAQNTFQNAQQSLVLRVAQAYFDVLSARDTLRADEAARDAFRAERDEARAQFQVGLTTITAVQQAQASLDSSQATLIGDRRTLENARQGLTVIVGHPVAALQPLLPNIPLVPPTPDTADAWVRTAQDDNLDLRGALLQWQIAQREVGIQRAQRYPTLNLQGSVGQSDTGGQSGIDQRQYAIGLVMQVPIFEGGLIRSQIRQAAATSSQNQSQYQLAQRNTTQQVRDAYLGVTSGIAAVRSFKQAVISNRTALKSTQMGLQVGTQTETDVLTAVQNLYSSLKNYYQARYQYLDAVLSLDQLAGHLTVADLERIDALLDTDPAAEPPLFPRAPLGPHDTPADAG